MKTHGIIILLSILFIYYNVVTTTRVEEKDPIDLRIRHLKHQLMDQLQDANKERYETDIKEMYDYIDNSDKPITPISEHDKRKLDDRYKLPELKTTTTEKYIPPPESSIDKEMPLRSEKKKKTKPQRTVKKPDEIFYRKRMPTVTYDVSNNRNSPQKWTHCLDLLSPYLNGYKVNVSTAKIYDTDNNIRRLSYLLTLNMSDATTEDIRATLYEISNLPIRVYHWDVSAVKAIIKAIVRDRTHDFKGLKYGFKELFNTWKLNTSNLTRLLSQSRIFRPPCIQISDYGGSTVGTQKAKQYTITTNKYKNIDKSMCGRRDEDC